MKLAFIADPHVANFPTAGGPVIAGVNQRCELVLKTLRSASELANQQGCQAIIVLGDLFDTTRPLPQVQAAVKKAFAGSTWPIFLMGNHDRNSGLAGDHALGAIEGSHEIAVYEKPGLVQLGNGVVGMLPFREEPVKTWFRSEVEKLVKMAQSTPHKKPISVLCVHFGIHDQVDRAQKGNFWIPTAADALDVESVVDVMNEFDIDFVFAGNWHGHKEWDFFDTVNSKSRKIVQVGTLCPTGWDNPGFDGYGTVSILNAGEITNYRVSGPRFVKVTTDEELELVEKTAFTTKDTLFIRYVCDPTKYSSMTQWISTRDGAFWYEVEPDRAISQTLAVQSAQAAKSQETLADSAREFVANMELKEGVRRDEVWNLTKRFLRLP